jgi:hypothetical protein
MEKLNQVETLLESRHLVKDAFMSNFIIFIMPGK